MQAADAGLRKSVQHSSLLLGDWVLSIGSVVFGVDFGLFSRADGLTQDAGEQCITPLAGSSQKLVDARQQLSRQADREFERASLGRVGRVRRTIAPRHRSPAPRRAVLIDIPPMSIE